MRIGRLTMRWWIATFWAVIVVVILGAGIERGEYTVTRDNKPVYKDTIWAYYGIGSMSIEKVFRHAESVGGDYFIYESWSPLGGGVMAGSVGNEEWPIGCCP